MEKLEWKGAELTVKVRSASETPKQKPSVPELKSVSKQAERLTLEEVSVSKTIPPRPTLLHLCQIRYPPKLMSLLFHLVIAADLKGDTFFVEAF